MQQPPSTERTWVFGPNQARLIAPDHVALRFVGPTSLEHAHTVVAVLREAAQQGPIYVTADVSQSTLNADARAYIAEHLESRWVTGVAFIAAGLIQRAIAKGLMIAGYMTGRWTMELAFVDTAAHADAWVQQQRERRARGAA